MFRAEHAEIVLFPSVPGDSYLLTSVAEARTSVMAEAPAAAWKPIHQYVIEHGKAFLLNTTALELEDDGDVRDAMIAPLGTDGGVIGAMLIANRLGDVSTFTAEDLRLFATVANHAGTALENGQLERSLAKLSVLQDELKHQAFHDGLTQLANRGLFGESVNARLAATPPGGGRWSCSSTSTTSSSSTTCTATRRGMRCSSRSPLVCRPAPEHQT